MSTTNEPFGRQPQPVKITFEGDQRDIDRYFREIYRKLSLGTYDNVERNGNVIMIYPRAVND